MDQSNFVSKVISTSSTTDLSLFGLVASADYVSKFVMLALVLLSIWSWAIIFDKLIKFRSIKIKMKLFEENFWSGQPIDHLFERAKRNIDNSLAAVFVAAISEIERNNKSKSNNDLSVKIGQKDRLMQTINLVRNRESEKIESHIGFLASVGAYAPFVGLFGTVWGIMHSFQSIASSKNTSLAVVAPGIAEALLATAIGLLAAIPAVAFYNYLISVVNSLNNRTEDFSVELYTILSRNIDEEK